MIRKTLLYGRWLAILAVPLLLLQCYPEGIETTDDLTIVFTQYNQSYDFGGKTTYYMADTIGFASNIDEDDIDWDEVDRFEATILDEVKSQMEVRGYTHVDSIEAAVNPPDMVMLITAVLSKNSGASWWPGPGYWWGWGYPPGWGYPGGGWYYPPGWGGGYWTYYSYSTGTVMMYLADYESFDDEDEEFPELEWEAVIDGLIQGVSSDDKITKNVGQAFVQSPYLKTN